MARLRKGDLVALLSGKDRGKQGKILKMLPDRQAALVERLNLVKHFERRTQVNQSGGILEREAPIALGKLTLVCPRCGRPTRVGFRVSEGSASAATSAPTAHTKARVCKRCHDVVGG